jgi:hypothetical protein
VHHPGPIVIHLLPDGGRHPSSLRPHAGAVSLSVYFDNTKRVAIKLEKWMGLETKKFYTGSGLLIQEVIPYSCPGMIPPSVLLIV